MFVWENVDVHYCDEYKVWRVAGYDKEGNSETISYLHHKADAIDDARIYAFDTSCGEPRGRAVHIYSKDGRLMKTEAA